MWLSRKWISDRVQSFFPLPDGPPIRIQCRWSARSSRIFIVRLPPSIPGAASKWMLLWIFDACIEALGREEAMVFLETLRKDLEKRPVYYFDDGNLADDLAKYLAVI